MKNLYKRTDIFRCVHEAHKGFKNNISVYHILKEKGCYPHGCFYFNWQCKELSKRNTCHRGFHYVGRKCFNCRSFREQKIHNHPELQISEDEYRDFTRELDRFEDWIEENKHSELEIAGTVSGIKPHFVRKVYPKASHLSFKGYMIIFKEAFLGYTHMEDHIYAHLSGKYYQKLRLGKGDKIEAKARFKIDRGRIVLYRLRNVEIIEKGQKPLWDMEDAVVAQETATEFSVQPEACVQCPFGALTDVEYLKDHHSYSRRRLLCLKGMSDYRDCYVPAEYCGFDSEAKDHPSQNCEQKADMYFPK